MLIKYALSILGNLLFILGLSVFIFTYVPIVYSELNYQLNRSKNQEVEKVIEEIKTQAEDDSENIEPVVPIDKNFSIIIPKINLNVPVVKNVNTADAKTYMEALRSGAAHSVGTAFPGENGNTFIFAHSSLNFWQLGEYATAFNLLHNLETGDTITLTYKGRPYLYKVFDKEIINGWNTEPYDEEYEYPVVTLVTCTPPGSTVNRLVVKASMVDADLLNSGIQSTDEIQQTIFDKTEETSSSAY